MTEHDNQRVRADVLAAAAQAVPASEAELSVYVHIANVGLWRRLQAVTIGRGM